MDYILDLCSVFVSFSLQHSVILLISLLTIFNVVSLLEVTILGASSRVFWFFVELKIISHHCSLKTGLYVLSKRIVSLKFTFYGYYIIYFQSFVL